MKACSSRRHDDYALSETNAIKSLPLASACTKSRRLYRAAARNRGLSREYLASSRLWAGPQSECSRKPFPGLARVENAGEGIERPLVRKGTDAAPQFRADWPSSGPAFVGIIDEHGGEVGVGTFIEALDRAQPRADEQSFKHHLVPSILIEHVARKRVAVGHGLKNRRHCRPDPFSRPAEEKSGRRKDRKTAKIGDEFIDLGGPAKGLDGLGEGRIVAAIARQHESDARRLIDAEPGNIPAAAQCVSLSEVVFRQNQVGST